MQEEINLEQAKNSVGKGWHSLLESAYEKLPYFQKKYENNATSLQKDAVPKIFFTVVKEKFGALRIYPNLPYENEHDDEFYDFIIGLEEVSNHTCEECGQEGSLCTRSSNLKTLCTSCANRDGYVETTNNIKQIFFRRNVFPPQVLDVINKESQS